MAVRLLDPQANRRPSSASRAGGVPPGGYNLKYKATIRTSAMTRPMKSMDDTQVDVIRSLQRKAAMSPDIEFNLRLTGSFGAFNNFRKKVARSLRDAAGDGQNEAKRKLQGRMTPYYTGRTRVNTRGPKPRYDGSQTTRVFISQGKMNPQSRFRYIGPLHDGVAHNGGFNSTGTRYWFYKATDEVRLHVGRRARLIRSSPGSFR